VDCLKLPGKKINLQISHLLVFENYMITNNKILILYQCLSTNYDLLWNYGIFIYLYIYSLKLIYSYRIEQAMAIRMLDNQYKEQDISTENKITKKLIYAVDIQRKAIKLVSIRDIIYIFVRIFYFFKVFRIYIIQL